MLEDMRTGADLFDYVMMFGGQPGGSNDDFATTVKAAIRKEYWDLMQKHRWWWAAPQRPATITVEANRAVTISTIAGVTVTLSVPISTSQAGKKIMLDANLVPYRIVTHTAGTNVCTLDAEYAEDQTSGRATIYQDEYAGAIDCLKPWGPFRSRTDANYLVDLIPYVEFENKFGWGRVTHGHQITHGTLYAARQDPVTGRMQQIYRFNATSDRRFVLEFPYTVYHNIDFSGTIATDCPLVPETDRWVIAEMALWTLWRNKNNNLADSAFLKASKKIESMETAHLSMETRTGLFARQNHSIAAR